jgi:isoquinoline 1-oxidoreductase alpha subunit
MPVYNLNINGETRTITVDADTPLLWVLRDELNLVGTKYGCGIAQCGACTVHVDNVAMRACSLPVSALDSTQKITTIEGLSKDASHVLQEAWREHDVPQCGYCQAGQIMSAAALLKENKKPSEKEIDQAMRGNLCRCGTYTRIKKAIQSASQNM